MNILEINLKTLSDLYEQFPESFKDLSMNGNYLVYKEEQVDISKFNINDLLGSETAFAASLSVLTSEDIFRIIRLHAIHLESKLDIQKKDNVNKIEIIKQENPLMKNISIATRRINGSLVEYINIVDSNGESHLFENDRNVNIFNIYEELKLRSAGRDITPDELIYEIDRRLYQIRMQKAGSIMDSSNTSEDFSNKIKRVNEPYKNDRTTDVFGNEEHDVAIVSDLDDPTNHKVVTFDKNEFGDLVLESHEQNVVGTDTTLSRDGKIENSTSEAGMEGTLTEGEVFEKDKIEVAALLISTQEFYDLLNSPEELTEEQRKSVDLYYGYFGDLILYEDYLLPELKQILEDYRRYVYELQFGEVPEGQERLINSKQQEAVDKSYELEQKAAEVQQEELTEEKVKDGVKKLELMRPVNDYGNTGSISIIQVLAIIIGVSIILTAVTLYLLG